MSSINIKQGISVWNRSNNNNEKDLNKDENNESNEQKKRKSKKNGNKHTKEKSVDLSETENKSSVIEYNGRRKKCKNPNCRCRERKRKLGEDKKEQIGKKKAELAIENGKIKNGIRIEEIEEKNEQKWKSFESNNEEEKEKKVVLDEEERRKAINALNFCFSEIQAQIFFECIDELPIFLFDRQNDWRIDEKRLTKVGKMDQQMLANLRQKGIQLEKIYKLNCTTVGLVTRKLLVKDPTLRESLKNPLMEVMHDLEQEICEELDTLIDGMINNGMKEEYKAI